MRKLFFLFIIQFLCLQTVVLGQVFYTVSLGDDNKTYTVKMRPEVSYAAPLNNVSSFQVAFRVPTGGFKVGNLTSINGKWEPNGNYIAPTENPASDYLTFELSGSKQNIAFVANEETELFSFENVGECTGSLDFVAQDDLFWPPNAQNANIGNIVSVLGAGPGNAYAGPYGPPANCLMSQTGNTSCETIDSIVTTNPRECGTVGGTITIFAKPDGLPLRYSIDDGRTFQRDSIFTGLSSATTYVIVVADELGICYKEHGTVELGPPADAVIIDTYSTADSCSMNNGTLTVVASPVAPGTTLEYSNDEGATWHENDGHFTGLSAGTYKPRIRLKDAPCYDETEEIVVSASCPNNNGNNPTDTANTNCIYTVVLDATEGLFTISIIADRSMTFPNNTVSTALFSIKVPTGSFEVSNLQDINAATSFDIAGISVAPTEAPEYDYISFTLSSRGPQLDFVAGEKIPLFSFENSKQCSGKQVFLVDNYIDPFYNNGQVSTGQQLTVAGTIDLDETRIICTQSNNISDCGESLDTNQVLPNFSKDTLYVTLPVEETSTVCIGDELEIANADLGTVALCSNGGTVITSLTNGSNCLDITTDDHFNQTETVCIIHFDENNSSISDTTILILCPKVELGTDLNICAGETVTLSPVGGTGNFSWITTGNISCTDCANPEITPTTTTQYILMSTENDHCMDSDTLMVNVMAIPTIADVIATQPTNCEDNGQISITASGGIGNLRYSIDNGTTFQDSSIFNNLGAGDYTILVANQDETCSAAWLETITLVKAGAPSIIDVNVTAPNECKDEKGAISINATSSDTTDVLEYSIDGGTTWQANGTFNDLEEGNYNLMVRVQNSICDATFANNPIEVSPVAGVRITTPPSDQLICKESDKIIQLELNEAITNHTITGGPYEKDTVDNKILSFEANPLDSGSTYSVTLTGESGCSITEEFTLKPGEDTELWNPVITTTPASCDNNDGALAVVVNEDNNGFTFCWEPDKASGPMRTGLNSDSTYNLTITGASGCSITFGDLQTGTTCEVASCNIFTGLDTLNAFIFDGKATACIPITSADLSEYQFYENGVLQDIDLGECMQTSVFYDYNMFQNLGTAPFTLVEWSVNKDTLRDFEFNTVEELVIRMNQFDFQANWVLNESLTAIQGFSTANVYGVLKVQPSGSSQVPELQLNTMNTMYQSIQLNDSRGTRKFTLKDPLNDCEDVIYVKVQGAPSNNDTLNLSTLVNTPIQNQCLNTDETGTENLTIEVCNAPLSGTLTGIDGDTDECFDYTPNEGFIGKDNFCLVLCNGELCDTTLIQVTVNEEGLLFYTGFSPNDDDVNDVFTIKNIENYPDNNVIIYNRWGNRIFMKEGYTNDEGWDGTFTGKISPDGVYFYLVKVMINGKQELYSGPVMLSR